MCDAMAIAMHETYGYPIAVWRGVFPDDLGDEGDEATEDAHMCVVLPDGSWADVDGIHVGEPDNLRFDSPVTRVELVKITPEEARHIFTIEGVTDSQIEQAKLDMPILK
jgi:hypothetical protein